MMKKVKDTIRHYNLIARNDKILVGVSGGPDSVALLLVLNSLKKEFKFNLHVAHLDHQLRRESYKDREFVERLAGRLNLPINCARIKVKELAKKGSLEETARNARLGFLFRVAREIHAQKIALGHHLDDQAETVLMRILRGTGLYGLSAISPRRNIAGFTVIRPLIVVTRREIEGFLRRRKIKPCLDTSNLKGLYSRNRIRNKLFPLLEREYNRNIKEVLSNLAESAGLDYDYLNQIAHRVAKKLGRKINLVKFLRFHPALQRLVLRLNITRLKGDTRRINYQHIKEIEDLISSRPVNSIVDLPGGVSVIKKKKTLSFYLR